MDILLKYFPGLSPTKQEKFKHFQALVLEWNQRINLISRKDAEHLPERHILHSLGIALHARFAEGERILDVGTGGGFPGLPLAIMFPGSEFILIDSIGKKIKAVSGMATELELGNVQCRQVRAEDYGEKVQHVVSRAVTRIENFVPWIKKNLTSGMPGETMKAEGRVRHGLWYLKGGDLEEELSAFPEARVYELKDHFSEAFFESKKVVWIPAKVLA